MVCCSQGLECVHDTNALVGMTPEVNDLILAAHISIIVGPVQCSNSILTSGIQINIFNLPHSLTTLADEETKTESTDGRGGSISLEEETTRMALLLLGSISQGKWPQWPL